MTGIFCVSPLSLPSAFTSLPSLSSPYLPSLISTSPSHCSSPTLPSYPLPFPLPLHPPLLALPSLPPLPSPSFVLLPSSTPSHCPSPGAVLCLHVFPQLFCVFLLSLPSPLFQCEPSSC